MTYLFSLSWSIIRVGTITTISVSKCVFDKSKHCSWEWVQSLGIKNPTNHNLPTYISLVMLFQWALTGLCHRSFESFSKSVGAINCPFVFSFRYRNESGEMVENKRFWSLLNVVPFSQTNVGPSLISNATHIPQYRHHPLFFIEGLLFRFSSLTDPKS